MFHFSSYGACDNEGGSVGYDNGGNACSDGDVEMDITFPLNIVPVSLICLFNQNEIRNIEVGYGLNSSQTSIGLEHSVLIAHGIMCFCTSLQ